MDSRRPLGRRFAEGELFAMAAASTKSLTKPFGLLSALWLAAGGAYILYAWITYTGLYRWAAEWEMAQFGSYEAEGTVIGLFIALIGLPAGLLALLGKKLGRPAAGAGVTHAPPAKRQVSPRTFALIGLAAIAVAVGSGWLGYRKSQQPVAFEAVNLSDHRAPQSTHVEMTGVAQTGMIVEWEETINGNKTTTTYLPLTAPDWKESQPITYFLRPAVNAIAGPDGYHMIDANSPPFALTQKGVLFSNDLPGAVRTEYEKHGLTLASPAYVLDTKEDADLEIYWEVAAGAGITALVLLLSAALVPIAQRRAAKRQGRA
jgi:hypothetical protein